MKKTSERASSGSSKLDKMLNGGFLRGSATLVEGAAGTGKTTLGLQFLMAGMEKNEHTLLITFEEFPEQYYACAMELGWDLKAQEAKGHLDIIFISPENFIEETDEEEDKIFKLIEDKSTKRVVIDSITHLERLAANVGELRKIETDIVNFFKKEDITTILLKENLNIMGGWNVSQNKIPFIVDAYLLLRYIELESQIKRGLMILKMRGRDRKSVV